MDSFLGEIRMFAGTFAPKDWALCNGQLLSIPQNTALYSILGVNYGGDGRTTFGLPNLQARIPVHAGSGPGLTTVSVGEAGGSATVALTTQHMPNHTHAPRAYDGPGDTTSPRDAVWARGQTGRAPDRMYSTGPMSGQLAAYALPQGGSQPHNNRSPYLVVNFIICLTGLFPSRG